MNKVVDEISIEGKKILRLDEMKTPMSYRKYSIDGKTYNIVPVYDAKNCIAIESTESFIGKTVEYK